VGRTSRIALITLVAATVLGGCSGGSAETATEVPPELEGIVEASAAVTDFCTVALANVEAGIRLTEFSTGGTPPRPEEEIRAVLEPMRESNAQLLAAAPEQLQADLGQVAEVTELKLAAFEASGGDPAATSADPAVVEKNAAATEPSARVRQYLRTVCRIDPN
jgi:hypothetical protein